MACKKPFIALLFMVLSCAFPGANAVDNETLEKLFTDFEHGTEELIKALVSADWDKAKPLAVDMEKQAKNLAGLAEKDKNQEWLYDSSNLHNHSIEMVEAVEAKDAVEGVYLISIFISHLGHIQSANTDWLKVYVEKQIQKLEKAITDKDKDNARDAAEILHISSNKIVFSAAVQKKLYRHIRWLDDVREVNGLGDSIIADVANDDWSAAEKRLAKIKVIYSKWSKAFR